MKERVRELLRTSRAMTEMGYFCLSPKQLIPIKCEVNSQVGCAIANAVTHQY